MSDLSRRVAAAFLRASWGEEPDELPDHDGPMRLLGGDLLPTLVEALDDTLSRNKTFLYASGKKYRVDFDDRDGSIYVVAANEYGELDDVEPDGPYRFKVVQV